MEKIDNAQNLDTVAARRAACGHGVSQMTCAACRHVCHADGHCLLNDFPVNLDRGFCRNFDNIGKHKS